VGLVMDMRNNYKIFASPVVYPLVEKGLFILRHIPTAGHTEEDVNYTLNAFEEIREKIQQGVYQKIELPAILA
ncbi:MAG: pyridoxal phosphate-dependent aminotransferase family protein, partial [Bacteroidota bacterium]